MIEVNIFKETPPKDQDRSFSYCNEKTVNTGIITILVRLN